MIKAFKLLTFALFTLLNYGAIADSVESIKNYQQLNKQFASSGLPEDEQLTALKKAGFQQVVNLIPGDYMNESTLLKELGIGFEQIEVDWHKPTLADFKRFVAIMQSSGDKKVLVHCQLNYRASAFAYLYEVTQLDVEKDKAFATMAKIWTPEGIWAEFIDEVLAHYKK